MNAAPQPSLFAQLVLAEKYGGMRLTMDQLAEALGMARGSVYNQISAGTFPVPTYVEAGKRWADVRDVAAHFDRQRAAAKVAA